MQLDHKTQENHQPYYQDFLKKKLSQNGSTNLRRIILQDELPLGRNCLSWNRASRRTIQYAFGSTQIQPVICLYKVFFLHGTATELNDGRCSYCCTMQ